MILPITREIERSTSTMDQETGNELVLTLTPEGIALHPKRHKRDSYKFMTFEDLWKVLTAIGPPATKETDEAQ